LRYVLGHPVLRNISAMMALINLVSATVYVQLVVFTKHQLNVSDSRVVLLYAAGRSQSPSITSTTSAQRHQGQILGRWVRPET
jgi:hypothetical protein